MVIQKIATAAIPRDVVNSDKQVALNVAMERIAAQLSEATGAKIQWVYRPDSNCNTLPNCGRFEALLGVPAGF